MAGLANNELFWRLTDDTGQGLGVVTMVLPAEVYGGSNEFQLQTDVISKVKHKTSLRNAVDLKWSESDLELFLTLIKKMILPDPETEEIALDFSEEAVVAIVHIVAAARFATPVPSDEILNEEDILTIREDFDIGDLVAINTINGFKNCVIVDMDSVDATCVLLDDVDVVINGECEQLDHHDLMVVNRHSLLPADFGDVVPCEDDVIH